jgi:Xaa-Pro aminopeptidase
MKPEFFISNRQKILDVSDADVLVFTANRRMQRNGDNTYPFRQDSSFWYLTGLDEPNFVLVITKDRAYLIQPQLSFAEAIFDGVADIEAMQNTSGINEIYGNTKGWQELETDLKEASIIGYIAPTKSGQVNFVLNDTRAQLLKKLKPLAKKRASFKTLNAEVSALRVVKTDEEVRLIQKAVQATTEAFDKALARTVIDNYDHEYEVEAVFDYEFKKRGLTHAYSPIVASGKNACILHYNENTEPVQKNQLLLVDIGAELSNYAADITRTVPVGTPTARQLEVLEAVQDIQQFALKGLKPGASITDNEKAIELYVGGVLQKLGLIQDISREQVRRYYPHATSHFLGLDVHDVGDYRAPLAANMVLTVEPGIYIPTEGIGVRIEDNVVITETGCRVLSKNLPSLLS